MEIITSGPITSWNNGNSGRLYFLEFQNHCGWWLWHEIKRHLLLERKAMANLDSILKSRDITLPTKVRIVKLTGFPVFIYKCESWTIKKAERQRIDAFKLWCWRKLLRVPWTARRSNQSILRKSTLSVLWKDWCWSSNTSVTWYEEMTHWKISWSWERLKGGEEGGDRGQDGWMALLTQWTWVWASPRRWWRTAKSGVLHAVQGVTKSQTLLSDWTMTT